MSIQSRVSVVIAALTLGAACASAPPPKPRRVPTAVDERRAAARANDPVAEAEASEERFAAERARALREERQAREAESRRRVEVVGDKEKKPAPEPR